MVPTKDPLRSLQGRIAAHESWARTENRTERTANARAAMWQKFLDEANGDPVRAEHLRKVFYGRMALKSARARRKIKEARAELVAVEAEIDAAGGGVASSIWAAENA
jgi:hypothetical protein